MTSSCIKNELEVIYFLGINMQNYTREINVQARCMKGASLPRYCLLSETILKTFLHMSQRNNAIFKFRSTVIG